MQTTHGLAEKYVQRLLERIDVRGEDECWPWTARKHPAGYGWLYVGQPRRSQLAHRLMYEVFRGEIPFDLQIHHTCRQRACCNPTHLQVVDAVWHAREHAASRQRI